MKKLIIQIPAFNEKASLPLTLAALPRHLPGFDVVEWLVVDDGSTDETVKVALEAGVDHVVRHTKNQGLARAFATGIDACLRLGADIIVNTDADNQYAAACISDLVAPVVAGKADMVIGDRQTDNIEHFGWLKRRLQKTGSWVVRKASNTDIRDAPSGFRAISRQAALHLNIVSDFSYTIESIIQAGQMGMAVAQVPIRTNERLRESRLFKSLWGYVARSGVTILRVYSMYQPLMVFLTIGAIVWLGGFALGLRYLYYLAIGQGGGHVQSLLLGVLLLLLGFQTAMTGLLADLIRHNRRLIEEGLWRVRRIELARETLDGETALGQSPEPSRIDATTDASRGR